MSNNPARYEALDSVIRQICILDNDMDATQYLRVGTITSRVLYDLNLNLLPKVSTTLLEIKENMSVDFPENSVDIIKVGLCCDGKIQVLHPSHKVCGIGEGRSSLGSQNNCTCNDEESVISVPETIAGGKPKGCASCMFHNCFYYGNYYGEMYGYKVAYGKRGTYKIDYQNDRILFNNSGGIGVGTNVLVEYKSNIDNFQSKVIPRDAFMVIAFRTLQLMYGKQPTLAMYNFDQFRREWNMYKMRYSTISLEAIVAAFRSGYSPAPR